MKNDRFKAVKKTYLSSAIAITVLYAALMTLVYILVEDISVFAFFIIGILVVAFVTFYYLLIYIQIQKKYFYLQEMLSRSNITDEELAQATQLPIEKIKLLRMDFYSFSKTDLKNIQAVLEKTTAKN